MVAPVKPAQVLSLYRKLLRQSSLFTSFNFRKYAERRVKDHFKEKKMLTDSQQIRNEYTGGHKALGMLKRQTSISQMYDSAPKLVVEDSSII